MRGWPADSAGLAPQHNVAAQLSALWFTGLQDVKLAQQWLKALMAGGYRFPDLVSNTAWQRQQQQEQQEKVTKQPQQQEQQQKQYPADALPQTPQRPATPLRAAQKPSRWAVLSTAEAAPTPIMKQLAALDGWRVVVVAEQQGPHVWSWPNITYLSLEQQEGLGYAILRHLPKHGPG